MKITVISVVLALALVAASHPLRLDETGENALNAREIKGDIVQTQVFERDEISVGLEERAKKGAKKAKGKKAKAKAKANAAAAKPAAAAASARSLPARSVEEVSVPASEIQERDEQSIGLEERAKKGAKKAKGKKAKAKAKANAAAAKPAAAAASARSLPVRSVEEVSVPASEIQERDEQSIGLEERAKKGAKKAKGKKAKAKANAAAAARTRSLPARLVDNELSALAPEVKERDEESVGLEERAKAGAKKAKGKKAKAKAKAAAAKPAAAGAGTA